MKTAFDPLKRLTTQESIRFIGTIGGVLTNLPEHMSALLELFIGREVRTATELAERIEKSAGCKPRVAAVSVEEAAALGLIVSLPSPSKKHKRYLLDDGGRVVNSMRGHRDWTLLERRRQLFFRPMFEFNGDYLLQALAAVEKGGDQEALVNYFRASVQAMATEKVEQLSTAHSGSKWDSYRQAVIARKCSIYGESGAIVDGNLSLEALQKQRSQASHALLDSFRSKRETHRVVIGAKHLDPSASKTLEHHYARSRAWLEGLGLVEQVQPRQFRLSGAGIRLLAYLRRTLQSTTLSIPPSFSTLADCFRLNETQVAEIWGAVIDDNFWEEAILAMENEGSYVPTNAEVKQRFDQAFDSVRVPGITEAMLTPLRQTLFFRFLWDGKPIRTLDSVINGERSIPFNHPTEYGFGRNRQGRLAYLFRKR